MTFRRFRKVRTENEKIIGVEAKIRLLSLAVQLPTKWKPERLKFAQPFRIYQDLQKKPIVRRRPRPPVEETLVVA